MSIKILKSDLETKGHVTFTAANGNGKAYTKNKLFTRDLNSTLTELEVDALKDKYSNYNDFSVRLNPDDYDEYCSWFVGKERIILTDEDPVV